MIEAIFEILQRPYAQAFVFLLLTVLFVFIVGPKRTEHIWSMTGLVFIGFILVNSMYICFASNPLSYFFYSLLFSVLYLACIAILLPALIKLLKTEGSAEGAMIFIFIIYHPAFLLFVLFLKWIYLKIF